MFIKYIIIWIWNSQVSGFPDIANTGLAYESPENMAQWQYFTVSFCLLRGLNGNLSGDVLSAYIVQILPCLHLGLSVRSPQWENPVEYTQHRNVPICFWTILWNLISILFVLQNSNMLKPHYILSCIKFHRIQLLFFISNSTGFSSLVFWPYVYKRDGLQGMSIPEKGMIPTLSPFHFRKTWPTTVIFFSWIAMGGYVRGGALNAEHAHRCWERWEPDRR